MANPNDNSELFEIFQNQVDLDQDQDEEEDENEEDQEQDQNEQTQETADSGASSDPSESPSTTSGTGQPEERRSTRSPDSSQTTNQEPSTSASSSPESPEAPSSTDPPEDGGNPNTETGSYIQDLEDDQTLDGKIVLSRGASVFLLLVVFIALVGSYFIGLQTGSNQQVVENNTATATNQNQDQQTLTDTTNGTTEAASGAPSDNQTGGDASGGDDNPYGIVAGQAYYTIGLIAYKASQENVQNYVSTIQTSLRQEANLRYVSSVRNPTGNRQIWVVVGFFKDRDTAKQKLQQIEDNLNRTPYRGDFTKDILEISSEQARNIANSG